MCDCTKNSTAFTVNNISAGAEIELLYSDKIFVHHTFEGTSENWNKRGDSAALGEAWSTCYATDSQNHMHALKISNRTYGWNGAQFALDINKFVPGHIYSFSAYVLYKSPNTDSNNTESGLNPSNVTFKLTLQYNDGSGVEKYNTIAFADNALSNNWYHLSNANFTIPAGATNMFLVIETVETYNDSSNNGKYVDIYLDEVIIASEGAGIEVDKKSGDIIRTNNVKFVSENIPTDIQNSANNWFLDNSWSKNITLEKSKGWTITETNLGELSNRIYQYYVEEVSVPGFTTNYLYTNVSANTPDSPIIIQNKAIQYTLPPTGGSGTEKYKTAGLILIFVASAAFIIKRKKFDIKKG